MSDLPVPGGIGGALAALGDPLPPDRSQFLLEFVRRMYQSPIGNRSDPREPNVRSLGAYLDKWSAVPAAHPETIPLPLTPEIWTSAVFAGRVTQPNLLAAIVRSRSASLLYYGLLSVDDATRAWIATRPDLLTQIVAKHAAAFATAAHGLRIVNGVVSVPGGEAAAPIWTALTGKRLEEPAEFIRALLAQAEGRLAYFYAAVAELSAPQGRFVLSLDADVNGRTDAGRRLFAVIERLTPLWSVEDRTFSRPPLDPMLLAADLRGDSEGRPHLPGSRKFWAAALEEAEPLNGKGRPEPDLSTDAAPIDFPWLCEEIFKGDQMEQRRRYYSVLFASRRIDRITPETAVDALEAVRAVGTYPALVATLERARLTDVAVFAAAARRAAQLSAIGDDFRANRALAQFQGALALVTRGASRASWSADALPELVRSLCEVEVSARGDYEGRVSGWLDAHVRNAVVTPKPDAAGAADDVDDGAAGPVEHDLLRLLAGRAAGPPRFVDWEGTHYRVDFATTETLRLARALGDRPQPLLTSARTLVEMAATLDAGGLTRETMSGSASALDQLARTIDWTSWQASDVNSRYRDAVNALQRAARDDDVRGAHAQSASLRLLADDLTARGLMELVYAASLGQPDGATILALDAATRHEFGPRAGARRPSAWRLPIAGAGTARGWHVAGSLLGLDVGLAEFSLVRLSSKPPVRRPSLNEDDRRAFTEVVPLVDALSLAESTGRTIVEAMRRGRARVDGARTSGDVLALAGELHLSGARRTLFAWAAAHEPARASTFLSPVELLWAGLDRKPLEAPMQFWGSTAGPRLGCLCLQVLDRRPWESLTGRWSSGVFASAFPDLNLRLTELLAELRMPASLLGPVLASATLDFVNTATSRDQDDRRGLVEFVRALRVDRVEQYLALLTTDGPLFPVGEASQPNAKAGISR